MASSPIWDDGSLALEIYRIRLGRVKAPAGMPFTLERLGLGGTVPGIEN